MPRDQEPHDTGIRPEDLVGGRPRPFQTVWGEFALYPLGPNNPSGPDVRAASCFCPHMQGPLFEGTLVDGEITCPWHLWTYSVDSGSCLASPREEGQGSKISVLPVRLGPKGTYLAGPPSE